MDIAYLLEGDEVAIMVTFLMMDEDKTLGSMLKRRLESIGYSATCTHTLTDGMTVAHSNDFDVVFLDVNLPDGNGLGHLNHFARVPSTPEKTGYKAIYRVTLLKGGNTESRLTSRLRGYTITALSVNSTRCPVLAQTTS